MSCLTGRGTRPQAADERPIRSADEEDRCRRPPSKRWLNLIFSSNFLIYGPHPRANRSVSGGRV